MQVAAQLTPSDAATVAGAMIWAYQRVTGRAPVSQDDWLMPLAQSAFETANWSALTHWNVGFISQPDASRPYFYRGINPVPFAVYATLGQGCVAMMRWLQSRGALIGADHGDLAVYVDGLRSGGYLGKNGDYVGYQNGIASMMLRYTNVVPTPYGEGPMSNLSTPKAVALGVGLIAAAGVAAYMIHPTLFTGPSKRRSWPRSRSLAMENPRRGPRGGTSGVQSLLFSRKAGWTPSKARAWARSHGRRYGNVDNSKPGYIRLRQVDPKKFRRMVLQPFGRGTGIKAVIGYR